MALKKKKIVIAGVGTVGTVGVSRNTINFVFFLLAAFLTGAGFLLMGPPVAGLGAATGVYVC